MVQAAGATGNSGLNIVERAVLAAASSPAGTARPPAPPIARPRRARPCPLMPACVCAGTPLYCSLRPEDGQGSARQLYLTKTANASPSH